MAMAGIMRSALIGGACDAPDLRYRAGVESSTKEIAVDEAYIEGRLMALEGIATLLVQQLGSDERIAFARDSVTRYIESSYSGVVNDHGHHARQVALEFAEAMLAPMQPKPRHDL